MGLELMYPDMPANSGAFLNCDLSTVYCVFDILAVALSTATEDKKSPADFCAEEDLLSSGLLK
jgi:hypothetical protein